LIGIEFLYRPMISCVPQAIRTATFFLVPICLIRLHRDAQFIRPPFHTGPIPVDPHALPWNSSRDPVVVAHLSDLHVSPHRQNTSVRRLREALSFIGQYVRPTFTIMTGDLTDNLEGISIWSPARPMKSHWELYSEIVLSAPIDHSRIVEVLGNHDTWGRITFDRRYSDYMLHPPRDDWFTQTYERDGVRVIGFVPVLLPAGRLLYGLIVPIYPSMVTSLEAALSRPTDSELTIVASHFPTTMMWPLKQVTSRRSGRNLIEVLSDTQMRVSAFLNGHTHPRVPETSWTTFRRPTLRLAKSFIFASTRGRDTRATSASQISIE
jgi:3',5'-cyclic AMP phosphodiesterase CpdA